MRSGAWWGYCNMVVVRTPWTPLSHKSLSRPNKAPLIELSARHDIEPLCQGQLDGLCGVYSVINAIRLALPAEDRPNERHAKELFEESIALFERNQQFAAIALEGMSGKDWLRLAQALSKKASTQTLKITLQRPNRTKKWPAKRLLAWIEKSIAGGMPVLASFAGALDHYTVIAAVSADRLYFFDSSGHHHVRKSNCGVRKGRHRLSRRWLMRVKIHKRR
jgi:hypothetical protein